MKLKIKIKNELYDMLLNKSNHPADYAAEIIEGHFKNALNGNTAEALLRRTYNLWKYTYKRDMGKPVADFIQYFMQRKDFLKQWKQFETSGYQKQFKPSLVFNKKWKKIIIIPYFEVSHGPLPEKATVVTDMKLGKTHKFNTATAAIEFMKIPRHEYRKALLGEHERWYVSYSKEKKK